MIKGRDRGEVMEFNFVDAQELLKGGLAEEVDLTQPGALEKKLVEEVNTLPFIVPPQTMNAPAVTASKPVPPTKSKRPQKIN
jgi:hypothetical protein